MSASYAPPPPKLDYWAALKAGQPDSRHAVVGAILVTGIVAGTVAYKYFR